MSYEACLICAVGSAFSTSKAYQTGGVGLRAVKNESDMERRPSTETEWQTRAVVFTRLWAIAGLLLMAVTWRIWTPQEVFPRVPLVPWVPPAFWDWLGLVLTVGGWVALVIQPQARWTAVVAGGFAMLFVADQHRLQPWAWQYFVLSVCTAMGGLPWLLRGARWLAISIYAWSALSKCDVAFVEMMSSWLGGAEATPWKWGSTPFAPRLPKSFAETVACIMPVGELFVALWLAWPRWRRAGLVASWCLHLSLLGLLGPWGLGHSWGVLVWNLYFLAQNAVLFWPHETPAQSLVTEPVIGGWSVWGQRGAAAGLIAAIIWPGWEPWGFCDAWLGWAVYVPRFEQVTIWIDAAACARLPLEVQPYVMPPQAWYLAPEGTSAQVRVGEWSLQALGVPVYPQPRFLVGVALDLAVRSGCEHIAVVRSRRAGRWQRWQAVSERPEIFQGGEALARLADTYRVPAFPEAWYRRQSSSTAAQ